MPLKSKQIDEIIELILKVGEEVKRYYYLPDITIEYKEDNSPVTIADKQASKLITNGLKKILPNIPVISEEDDDGESLKILKNHSRYWLVDPIDGTRSFIRKKNDFTINIGLIDDSKPVFGIIYQPITDILYYTDSDERAHKIEYGKDSIIGVNTKANHRDGLRIVIPHRNLSEEAQRFVDSLNICFSEQVSSSLKFCLVAEGKFDIYANFSKMFTWDAAAGHAILLQAGGRIYHKDGSILKYSSDSLKNPHFVAFAGGINHNYIKEKLASLT